MSTMFCECNSFDCGLRVDVPDEMVVHLARQSNSRPDLIAKGCQHKPPRSRLLEEHEGFELYRIPEM